MDNVNSKSLYIYISELLFGSMWSSCVWREIRHHTSTTTPTPHKPHNTTTTQVTQHQHYTTTTIPTPLKHHSTNTTQAPPPQNHISPAVPHMSATTLESTSTCVSFLISSQLRHEMDQSYANVVGPLQLSIV